jgi:hypothetical protein
VRSQKKQLFGLEFRRTIQTLLFILPDLTGAKTILDKIDKAVEYLKGDSQDENVK